jgi:hypothetical protein
LPFRQLFRENGDIFLAHTWFSSYVAPEGGRPPAVVVDSSEEMRDREEQALRQSMRSNRIAATAFRTNSATFVGPSPFCVAIRKPGREANQMTICKVFTLWSAD